MTGSASPTGDPAGDRAVGTRIALEAADAHPHPAHAVARLRPATPIPASIAAFADGETSIRIEADVAAPDLYIRAADFGADERAA